MNFVNTHRQALSIFFSLLVLVGSSFLLTDHAQAQRVRGKSVISPTNYASLVDPLIGTGQQALAGTFFYRARWYAQLYTL